MAKDNGLFRWLCDGNDHLSSRDVAIEDAAERAARTKANVVVRRLRPMEHADIDRRELVEAAWNAVRDLIQEHERYCHDDGGPIASDADCLSEDHADALGALLHSMCEEYVELADAAWMETDEALTVTPSGEVEER